MIVLCKIIFSNFANSGVGIQYMAPPAAIPGVPAGLEYLAMIDQLLVHQQVEMFECKFNLNHYI